MPLRFAILIAFPVVLFAQPGQRTPAQTSPAFTAVYADYWGCDPAVQATPACQPKANYTKYVDPNIGTAMVSRTANQTITLITKRNGTQIQALHEIKAYFTVNVKPAPPAESSAKCAVPDGALLGAESLLGIETFKYSRGSAGMLSWLAPSLNCFPLRSEFHFSPSPTFQVASNVTLGTPPASVFEPPAGFAEVSPMEAQHMITTLMMRRANPAMTAEEAEKAWARTAETNVGLQRQEATWRKQHGLQP